MHVIKTLIFIVSEIKEKPRRGEAQRRLQHIVISRGSILDEFLVIVKELLVI
mgnify:CR=1 FL=1